MKRSSKSFGKIASNLYQSIHHQLSAYAVAAVVGMLTLAQASEAKIVYTSANVVIENSTYNLDLNNDGIVDFSIGENNSYAGCSNKGGILVFLGAGPMRGNGIVGSNGLPIVGFPPPPAAALSTGEPIGPKSMYLGSLSTMAFGEHGWFIIFPLGMCERVDINEGNWFGATNRYLGLKFQIDGKTHYGWARLSTQASGNGFLAATLTGYAYETIAGKSIKAGQKKEADDPTNEDFNPGAFLTSPNPDNPPSATLGALATGAPGLSIWRRKESVT